MLIFKVFLVYVSIHNSAYPKKGKKQAGNPSLNFNLLVCPDDYEVKIKGIQEEEVRYLPVLNGLLWLVSILPLMEIYKKSWHHSYTHITHRHGRTSSIRFPKDIDELFRPFSWGHWRAWMPKHYTTRTDEAPPIPYPIPQSSIRTVRPLMTGILNYSATYRLLSRISQSRILGRPSPHAVLKLWPHLVTRCLNRECGDTHHPVRYSFYWAI